MHDTPTPEQIEQARRERDPMPLSYYVACAIAAASVLAALGIVLDVHWLFAPGQTL